MTAPTTNAELFIEFIKRAEAARTDVGSNKKLVIVLDQHPAHHAIKHNVRQLLTSRFRAYFLPASSSWLNSAEWIFALLKPMWRKKLLLIQRDLNQAQMEALMED